MAQSHRRYLWLMFIGTIVLLLAAYALVVWRSRHDTRQLLQHFERLDGTVEVQHIGPFGYRCSLFERFDLFPRVTEIIWLDMKAFEFDIEEVDELDLALARSISSQPYLVVLILPSPSVTDQVVKELSKSDSIAKLDVSSSKITDQSLHDLAQMKTLEDLHIDGTSITDDGLVDLSKSRSIKHLSLERTDVTIQGVSHLKQMQLDSVALHNTPAAEHDLTELKQVLPDVPMIYRGIFDDW